MSEETIMTEGFDVGGASDELIDVEDAGREDVRGVWTCTGSTVEERDNGKRLITTWSGPLPFEIQSRLWIKFTGSEKKPGTVQQIGRGQIKRLGNAALGRGKFSPAELVGTHVTATAREDARGFMEIVNFRKPTAADLDGTQGPEIAD